MREALSETLPVRIATGEIRAYLPVSSDEGMAAGSGTSLCLEEYSMYFVHKCLNIAQINTWQLLVGICAI